MEDKIFAKLKPKLQHQTQLQLEAQLVLVPIPPAPGQRASRPASKKSNFKPQFTLIVKIHMFLVL